jgi:hypothetical protein
VLFANFLLSNREKVCIIKQWRIFMAKLVSYKVYYRPVGSRFWRCLKDILEDGIIDGTEIRFFVNRKDERIELPCSAIELKFSPERVEAIEELNRKKVDAIKSGAPLSL